MLPCICSVTSRTRHQNVVRILVTHSVIIATVMPHLDVIRDQLLSRRAAALTLICSMLSQGIGVMLNLDVNLSVRPKGTR